MLAQRVAAPEPHNAHHTRPRVWLVQGHFQATGSASTHPAPGGACCAAPRSAVCVALPALLVAWRVGACCWCVSGHMFCRAACWHLGGSRQQEEWAVCISCVADCRTQGMLLAAAQ